MKKTSVRRLKQIKKTSCVNDSLTQEVQQTSMSNELTDLNDNQVVDNNAFICQQFIGLQSNLINKISSVEEKIETLYQSKIDYLQKLAVTEAENEVLINQLHVVQQELAKVLSNGQTHSESEANIEQHSENKVQPTFYGAADKVKNELPYRIGLKIVNNPRNLKALVELPVVLYQEVQAYKKVASLQNNLPLDSYIDVYEAEKVKKHLSYKIGEAFIRNSKSVNGWLKMPIEMSYEIFKFRKNKIKNK